MGSLISHHADLEIPIIDISGYLNGDIQQTAYIAKQLHSACRSPGFFQIIGHTVSSDLRSELLAKLVAFFALPPETKQDLRRGRSRCLRGYEAIGEQKLEDTFADQKEGFMIGPEFPVDARFLQGPNQWPSEETLPGFRRIFTSYFEEVHQLSKAMFRLMALSLSLDEHYFDAFVGSKDSISMCRAHRYPPATPDLASRSRGIGAHTDFGAMTLLLQDDIGGLEVYHKATETWQPVGYVQDAFVVNIGDMMERWTNGLYTSTRHRVISPISTNHRYSIAYFNEGLLDQMIECIPSCLQAGDRPLYEPVRAEDHLRARYGSTY